MVDVGHLDRARAPDPHRPGRLPALRRREGRSRRRVEDVPRAVRDLRLQDRVALRAAHEAPHRRTCRGERSRRRACHLAERVERLRSRVHFELLRLPVFSHLLRRLSLYSAVKLTLP